MKEFNSNIESNHDHPEGEFHSEYLEDFGKGQIDQEDDLELLSEEEISLLDENEKSDYYRKLEKKSELDEIKNKKWMDDVEKEKSIEEYNKLLDEAYKKDGTEKYTDI